jgi:vitamin B12/bleomycin/antimicrobial peptide transport system ATP-binding/permease protein
MFERSHQTGNRKLLISRFWRSASGYWGGKIVWLLVALLISTIILQLLVQYWINIWNRDFFNALELRNQAALWHQAQLFALLTAASVILAIVSVWGRMTVQRQWREWLSRHLIERWVSNDAYRRLRLVNGAHRCPEYRIAEDARLATDAPIDLSLGLISALLSAVTFVGVLWNVGGNLSIAAFGMNVTIPGYLVIAAVLYSAALALAMMLVGGRLAHVVEEKNQAEAELKSSAAHLRHCGEGAAIPIGATDEHSFVKSALDKVVARWRELCHQLMRTTLVTHSNSVVAPVFALVICIPKYLGGAMTLGEVIQAAAAFVIVQGALNWFVDNYQRLADLLSSMNRVSSLLLALDQLGHSTDRARGQLAPEHAQLDALEQPAALLCHAGGLARRPSGRPPLAEPRHADARVRSAAGASQVDPAAWRSIRATTYGVASGRATKRNARRSIRAAAVRRCLIPFPGPECPQEADEILQRKQCGQYARAQAQGPKHQHHRRHQGPVEQRGEHESLCIQSAADDVKQPQPRDQQAHQPKVDRGRSGEAG